MELGRGTGVNVRTTPPVTRPGDAWGFIHGTWSRLRDQVQPAGGSMPALLGLSTTAATPRDQTRAHPAAAPAPAAVAAPVQYSSIADADTEPAELPMLPMPDVSAAAVKTAQSTSILHRYVHQLSQLTGMVSCCVFDVGTGREVVHAGASPKAQELALHGAELLAALSVTSRNLGLGHALPDAAVTLGAHHLLLRAVPQHRGLALHAVLDKAQANLTLARLQVARMDALFDDAS
jgi:hypothetical protein